MRYCLVLCFCLSVLSCAGGSHYQETLRNPAEAALTCNQMAKSIFKNEIQKNDFEKTLAEKKLITLKEKLILVNYPRLTWINKVKKSLNQSLRNWNNNRYPAFYLFNEEEILPAVKQYAENIEKIGLNQVSNDDDKTTAAFIAVSDWIKSYSNYKGEIDQLLEERISLQYNINLLKKLKLDANPKDIQIVIKRAGDLKSEIITLRKEDKNLKLTINRLDQDLKKLDGTFFKPGAIKERIIRQAMLNDILTILQREMEYASKNGFTSETMTNELNKLTELISKADFSPVTYGVYKLESKIFLKEILQASKVDSLYQTIKEPALKIKTILSNFFNKNSNEKDQEKIGILKRLYSPIVNMSPKQVAITGGSLTVAAIGFNRYFIVKKSSTTEVNQAGKVEEIKLDENPVEVIPDTNTVGVKPDTNTVEVKPETITEEISLDNQAHLKQWNNTQSIETKKKINISQIIESNIDKLLYSY